MATDIVILTDSRYVNPSNPNWYEQNVLLEDSLVKKALEAKGLSVQRTYWDNPTFDWSKTKYAIFRTTWDYFDKFNSFNEWLKKTSALTRFINSFNQIKWNLDKHYLGDLHSQGINIPKTVFIEKGTETSLENEFDNFGLKTAILKPAIAGAARHTYKISIDNVSYHSKIFTELIKSESMLLQEYQHNIETKGEISLIFFGENYSHAVLKKAKEGDFRVQDDFGGTVHHYEPNSEEIEFAKKVLQSMPESPVYARVDILWDNKGALALGELELIEPELWFRKNENAAQMLSAELMNRYF